MANIAGYNAVTRSDRILRGLYIVFILIVGILGIYLDVRRAGILRGLSGQKRKKKYMSETSESKYYPRNFSFETPEGKAEIYWQTKNANHLLENYRDNISQWNIDHDLKFNNFRNIFEDQNIFADKVRNKRNIYYAISYLYSRKRYYFITFAIEKRFGHLFAVIITAYATNKSEHIKAYQYSGKKT